MPRLDAIDGDATLPRRAFLGGLSLAFVPALSVFAEEAAAAQQSIGAKALENEVRGLPADGVLAVVDGKPIHSNELIGLLFLTSPDLLFGTLEQVIRRKLVAAESEVGKVTVSDATLARFVDAILKKQIDGFHLRLGADRDFVAYLQERYGMSIQTYRSILGDVALENLLFERAVRFHGRQAERIQFRLYVNSDLEKTKAAHAKLEEGASFAALAKKESEDDQSAPSGGLYPPVPTHVPNVVVDAVKGLKVGKHTAVGSETRLGKTIFWIARLEARHEPDPRPFDQQSPEIEADLANAPLHEFEMRLWDQEVRTRHEIKARLGRA